MSPSHRVRRASLAARSRAVTAAVVLLLAGLLAAPSGELAGQSGSDASPPLGNRQSTVERLAPLRAPEQALGPDRTADLCAGGSRLSGAPLPPDPSLRAALRRLEARGWLPTGASSIEPLSGTRLVHLLCSGGPAARTLLDGLALRYSAEFGTGAIRAGGANASASGRHTRPLLSIELRVAPPELPLHLWLRGPIAGEDPERAGRAIEGYSAGRLDPGGELRGGVGVELGPVLLSAGRMGVQLGGNETGAIALGREATFDAVTLQSTWPLRIPVLGDFEFLVGAAPDLETRAVEEPWFAFTRTTLRPHPSLLLGLSRGILFGGDFRGGSVPFDPVVYGPDRRGADFGDAVRTVFGRLNDFDNQVAAIDLRWSLGRLGVPVTLLAEVGWEDADRSWGDPGLQLGIDWAPGDAATTFRYVYTAFGKGARWCPGCDRLPAYWYNHTRFQDGYRVDGELLGHPLGGYGRRHGFGFDHHADRLFLAGEAAWARRDRWNLVEGARPGDVIQLEGRIDALLAPDLVLRLASGFEGSGDVTLWRVEGGVEWRLGR